PAVTIECRHLDRYFRCAGVPGGRKERVVHAVVSRHVKGQGPFLITQSEVLETNGAICAIGLSQASKGHGRRLEGVDSGIRKRLQETLYRLANVGTDVEEG